jgi:hypothetical protein
MVADRLAFVPGTGEQQCRRNDARRQDHPRESQRDALPEGERVSPIRNRDPLTGNVSHAAISGLETG